MSECSNSNATGDQSRRRGPTPDRARRAGRLAAGVLAIAALGFAMAQAGRVPGPLGDGVRANIAADRDATALFYTEVDGWEAWAAPR